MPLTRIFVSSVQGELAAERRALRDFVQGDALLRRFFEVFLFEDLPAADRRADETYLAEVDRCDLYVGLFGRDYGSEDAEGLSPTGREFDRATAAGKTRLVYLKRTTDRHPKMAALVRRVESQVVRRVESQVVRRVESQVVRRQFDSEPALKAALYASLVDWLERTGRLRTKPFDAAACPEAGLDDLAADKLEIFLGRAQTQRGYVHGPGTPMAAALAHLNLLDQGAPSHAAVLLFGSRPQRFLPSSEVKCMHFHGTAVSKPIPSYQVFKGTVFDLVDAALDFVLSKVARRVGTRAESTQVPVNYELPREAVAEAIVNAVAHRDYASGASVQVMLFADRLEVWNPGELPPALTLEGLLLPHASIPRNPLIAEPMFLAGYVEKAGSGTLDMATRCRAAGLPPPEFRQTGGQFVLVLRRPPGEAALEVNPDVTTEVTTEVATDEPMTRLLGVLVGEMTRQQLQQALGLKNDEHFRKAYLQPALAAGLIEMTVPDKPQSRSQKYRKAGAG